MREQLERIAQGDRAEYESFVRAHIGSVHAVARKSVKEDAEAKALTRSVMIEARQRIEAGERPEYIRSWLFDLVGELAQRGIHEFSIKPTMLVSKSATATASVMPTQEYEMHKYAGDEGNDDFQHSKPVERRSRRSEKEQGVVGLMFAIIGLSILLLLTLWVLIGQICSLGILPQLDLGYSWFNSHAFELFSGFGG